MIAFSSPSTSLNQLLTVGTLLASCSLVCEGFTLAPSGVVQFERNHLSTVSVQRPSHLQMSGFPHNDEDIPSSNNRMKQKKRKKRSAELSAAAITAGDPSFFSSESKLLSEESAATISADDPFFFSSESRLLLEENNFIQDWMMPVLSTSFLITANTVGASCLVLPDLAAGPGFATTCLVSLVTYVVNLMSGLLMAEVAIKQYESSGSEVASSFKDFADASFKSSFVSNVIAWVSILTNAGVLAFTFTKAGEVGAKLLGSMVDPMAVSFGFVGLVGVAMSTLNSEKLSALASAAVALLFASFAGLLLPGLALVQDPIGTFLAPGVADNCFGAAAQAFPIVLLSLVYQNIVPSVTKLLNYDRTKTTAALTIGSSLPLIMYMAWCFASMGGGIDTSVGFSGPLLTGFSIATIIGSSVGTTMSVAEEFDSFFKASPTEDYETNKKNSNSDVFSLPAVVAALTVPMAGAVLGSEDMTAALGLAGSIGTPLLYGVVPTMMAFNLRQESRRQPDLVPGGMASLSALGLASTGFVGQELASLVGDMASVVS